MLSEITMLVAIHYESNSKLTQKTEINWVRD